MVAPVSPVPQSINELRIYRGADDQLWAVNTADGHGWILAQIGDLPAAGLGAPAGVPEAPSDGAQYVRQNGAWIAIKPPPQPFAPTLTSISPSSVPAGSPDTVITFTGTGFTGAMQPSFGDQLMSWYAQMVNPLFISDTEFQATLGANLLSNPTTFFLWIQNTGGPDTNNLEFDVA